jgi:hypothetical protein
MWILSFWDNSPDSIGGKRYESVTEDSDPDATESTQQAGANMMKLDE